MTYIPKSSELLKALQESIGKQLEAREEQRKKGNSEPVSSKMADYNKVVLKKPTAEDILLMDEYNRGVYQGD